MSFVSYLYISHITQHHTNSESNIIRVLILSRSITSLNVILYNSSVNKLILCYILNAILCVFAQFSREHIIFKTTAELLCVSEQQSGILTQRYPRVNERIVSIKDSKTHS